jgi:filamentous hemagglutinin
VVGGGITLASQLMSNGGDWDSVNWNDVGVSAAAGAVTGALAGATMGASLVAEGAAGGALTVASSTAMTQAGKAAATQVAVGAAAQGVVKAVGNGTGGASNKPQLMDSSRIRFSQDSIKNGFKGTFEGKMSFDDTIAALKSGALKPTDISPIRIFEKDGMLYTLDNRRLYVAQQAGVKINYVWATEREIAKEIESKFTTINGGASVIVRN